MKTVFQRALSLVMCLVLLCSTMSVMTFSASAQEPFSYKTYAQNATKENVHYLFDFLDDTLDKANRGDSGTEKNLQIEIELLKEIPNAIMLLAKPIMENYIDKSAIRTEEKKDGLITKTNVYLALDLSSVDAICKTVDNYRGVVELATNEKINELLDLGDLKNIKLDVFAKGLSRSKSGDYTIFYEVLELANANSVLIEKLLNGRLNLGVIGSAVKLDLDVSKMLREGVVDALFKDKPNYADAKNRALTNFDTFVYTDLVGLVSAEGGILEGIKIDADTTVNALITDAFDILVDKYLVDLVEGLTFSFEDTLGEKYKDLDTIIQLDGEYDFTGIEFTKEKSVLAQINGILGKVFAQVVPGFTEWKVNSEAEIEKDYKNIGDNTRKLVQYIANESKFIEDADKKSDDALMLEILKVVFQAADTNGEKEIYELTKDTKTLIEMANKIVIHLSGKEYPASANYEHVFGDYVIEKLEGIVPFYDVNGKAITADGTNTIWEVLNSVFNFFLVDKNIKAYLGKDFKKSQSFFEKFDLILDYTADDGESAFKSEPFFRGLFEDIFTMDLQGFVDATAVKALKFAGKASVVEFLYNTIANILNNWTVGGALEKQTSGYFEAAICDEGLAKIVKAVIETLSKRSEGTACLIGLIAHFITDISEKVDSKEPTCTATGYKTTKTCLKCNKVYLKGATIAAKGHKYDAGKTTKNPTCTGKGSKLYTCTVCGYKKTQDIAAKGHKASGYKTTKKATYKTKGQQVNTCTVCKATLGTKTLNMLTLNKPTGLKATALSTSSIKFSWNKVTGAESYTLYYRAGSGKWKAVNTKNKTYYTVKKLKTDVTYRFKVVAVAGSNKSRDSSTVYAATKPSTVTIKGVRSSKKKEIIAEWKKISGVTGYEVQYSTSKKFTKSTTKTVSIKKQSTYKTYIKKLKSKKTYYIRIRAYKTVNKVKVYGAYSKVKSVKCK